MADPCLSSLSFESEFFKTVVLSGESLADVGNAYLLIGFNLGLLGFSVVS